jgi:hypothetical protein
MQLPTPKTKDKDGSPIVIYSRIYDELTQNAHERDFTGKKYANDLLDTILLNIRYLKMKFPNLSYSLTSGNFVILEDTKNDNKRAIIVKAKKDPVGFECENDKSENCEHVKYAMLSSHSILSLMYVEENDIE